MRDNSSSDIIVIAIVLALLFASGILEKLEITYDSLFYRAVCVYVDGKSSQECERDAEAIRSLKGFVKPFKGIANERARQVLLEVQKHLAPIQVFLAAAFLLILYRRELFSSGNSAKKGKVRRKGPRIFSSKELQKVVDNFYSIGGNLTEEEVSLLRSIVPEKARLAAFMIVAQRKMNFPASEVAEGVKDEIARDIIFSAGRPAVPPRVLIFFLQAEKKLSGGKAER